MGEHAGAAFHAISDLDCDTGRAVEQDVGSRSEFDEAHALAALQTISDLRIEDNAASQKAGDLLEDYGLTIAFNGDDVLLVLVGTGIATGIEKFPALVANIATGTGDWSAVDVHIEDAEKDAEAQDLLS